MIDSVTESTEFLLQNGSVVIIGGQPRQPELRNYSRIPNHQRD